MLFVKYGKFQTVHENMIFLHVKPLEFYSTKNLTWRFLWYQYIFKYYKTLNTTYTYPRVFVRTIDWCPFYMAFYQYVRW